MSKSKKPGRPPGQVKEDRRDKPVSIRFSADELCILSEAASLVERTVSDYIRVVAMRAAKERVKNGNDE